MHSKSADKLFLVAIPSGKLLSVAQSIQAKLNEKYRLYSPLNIPPLHVTIDHLLIGSEDDYNLATELIQRVCDKTPVFDLTVKGFSFFHYPHKSINLYVEKTMKLKELADEIHTLLDEAGLSTRPHYAQWEFHISLLNTVFASRTWCEEEFIEAQNYVKNWGLDLTCKIEWLELWKPKYEPQLIIEDFFPLKGN